MGDLGISVHFSIFEINWQIAVSCEVLPPTTAGHEGSRRRRIFSERPFRQRNTHKPVFDLATPRITAAPCLRDVRWACRLGPLKTYHPALLLAARDANCAGSIAPDPNPVVMKNGRQATQG